VDAIREYVRNGGCVYASGYTSIRDDEGNYKNDFMLADVFGIKYEGVFDQDPCYISPTDAEPSLFGIYTAKYPHMLKERFLKATATSGRTLATVTLPYSIPEDYTNFAAAISDPPVNWTDYVAIQENTFGKGRAIWVAGKPEDNEVHDNMKLFTDLVLHLLGVHPHLVAEKRHHARVEVLQEIVLQRAVIVREELPAVLHEAGIVHRRGAVDHGVVVVDDEAGIEHRVGSCSEINCCLYECGVWSVECGVQEEILTDFF
jgi:hypothetical protein